MPAKGPSFHRMPARSGLVMTDAAPILPSQPKSKHASIRAKILLALLLLSLLPLILFVALSLYGITNAEGYIRTELIRESQKDMLRLVKMQASVANAMLDKIITETQMTAFSADARLRNPSASGHTRSYSVAEKPEDPTRASKYRLLAVSSGQLGRHGCPQVHIGTAHGDCLGVRREFGFGGARRASQTLCREQCD